MILDRPMTEFELDCVTESQKRLSKDRLFCALKERIEREGKNLSKNTKIICDLIYEAGFFSGEEYAKVKFEKLKVVPNDAANDDEVAK